jgi:hypothetical protein
MQGVSRLPSYHHCLPLSFLFRFGFIKYHNFEDAEDCIRGFHYLGYEVSFARVSLLPSNLQSIMSC